MKVIVALFSILLGCVVVESLSDNVKSQIVSRLMKLAQNFKHLNATNQSSINHLYSLKQQRISLRNLSTSHFSNFPPVLASLVSKKYSTTSVLKSNQTRTNETDKFDEKAYKKLKKLMLNSGHIGKYPFELRKVTHDFKNEYASYKILTNLIRKLKFGERSGSAGGGGGASPSKSKPQHKVLNIIFDDILATRGVDYSNLTKGRSIEDTRSVLNYALLALYQINIRNERDRFNSTRFLDQVIIDPTEVLPEGLFEGDIVLTKDQAYWLFAKYLGENQPRKVIRESVFRWPSHVIPYCLDRQYAEIERGLIKASLKRWEESTCLNFMEIDCSAAGELHHLKFIRANGCWSPVGFVQGSKYQDISIGEGCFTMGTILHEVGHALGFFHEQSRPDRDDFVEIVRHNIAPFREINFQKYSFGEVDNLDIPYDMSSDMHYGSSYFSANNQITIATKDQRYQRTIGQRADISFSDIKAANMAYCKAKCEARRDCKRNGYTNPKNCSTCLCPDGFDGDLCQNVAQPNKTCGGLLTESKGQIQTPNYPLPYNQGLKCNWLIQAPPGKKVKLSFAKLFSTACDMFTAQTGPCDQDWIEIRDDSKVFYQGGPRYCCNIGPNEVVSVENEILILFRSTNSLSTSPGTSIGFKVNYEFIDPSSQTTVKPVVVTPFIEDNYCIGEPCLNGATCLNLKIGFQCACPDLFTGLRCEFSLSKCVGITCMNGGTCLEETGICKCPSGFAGDVCQTTEDACTNNPCKNGVCVISGAGYQCVCYANYTGRFCETESPREAHRQCRAGFCLNNGTCIESPMREGFNCLCTKNYFGIFCENSICSRQPNVCGLGGECVLKEEGGYYCKCGDGTIGERNCDQNPCSHSVCGDFGLCHKVNSTAFRCECTIGYTGVNCETKIKVCESNPCINGRCREKLGYDFDCECPDGYFGKRCDLQLGVIGVKNESSGVFCSSSPCLNNGICIERQNLSLCLCAPGFRGRLCEDDQRYEIDSASQSDQPRSNGRILPFSRLDRCGKLCFNGGECIFNNYGQQTCSCPAYFTGDTCLTRFNPCDDPNVCALGEMCLTNGYDHKCVNSRSSIEPKVGESSIELYPQAPEICLFGNHNDPSSLLRLSKSHHSATSYYYIQNGLIWLVDNGVPIQGWPKSLSQVFPGMDEDELIDAVIYDENHGHYLLFKKRKYWKYKASGLNENDANALFPGYPRFIVRDFSIESVEAGFFVKMNNVTNSNYVFLITDSKIILYKDTTPVGAYFFPFNLSKIELAINEGAESFHVLKDGRLFKFKLNYMQHQVPMVSVEIDVKKSFICSPFLNSKEKSEQRSKHNYPVQYSSTDIIVCPYIGWLNSIVRINSTTALMLTEDDVFEYLNITENGYRLSENPIRFVFKLPTSRKQRRSMKPHTQSPVSMIYFNKRLIFFKHDLVWIYSILDNTVLKEEASGLFKNFFLSRSYLNSTVAVHYSSESKKFYFFLEKSYFEYDIPNRIIKRRILRGMSAGLRSVWQNHESNDDSVYVVDSNNFIYHLNLRNNFLESVDRKTALMKLFDNCLFE